MKSASIWQIVAVVWAAATLVAFAWDTQWRNLTLVGLLVFWLAFAVVLGLRAKAIRPAFPRRRRKRISKTS